MPATLTSPEPLLAFTVFTPVTATSPDPEAATTPVAAGTLISYEIDTALRIVSSVTRPTLTASPVCSIGGLAATCLAISAALAGTFEPLFTETVPLTTIVAAGAGADGDVTAAGGDVERGSRADVQRAFERDRLRDSQDRGEGQQRGGERGRRNAGTSGLLGNDSARFDGKAGSGVH